MPWRQPSGLTAANVLPPGTIVAYGGAVAPTGWLLCDGSSVLRTDFPDLFTAIGTTYGSVDGTHFTLPDLRGRHVLGPDATHALGTTGGAIDHTHPGPAAHANHVITQPSNHAAAATAAANVGATPIGATASTATLITHTHLTPVLTHAGTTVDAHSAHGATGLANAPYQVASAIVKT